MTIPGTLKRYRETGTPLSLKRGRPRNSNTGKWPGKSQK